MNKNNAAHAVLFEAVSLAAQLDLGEDVSLITHAVTALGGFIGENAEPNIAYLGLNHLTNLVAPDTLDAIKAYLPSVIPRLHDVDISIRKRALDLLFAACDSTNAVEIVGHLLRYLTTADFALREELCLKTAILAERNAKVSLSHYHIPQTDCPYNTDIYFFTLRTCPTASAGFWKPRLL